MPVDISGWVEYSPYSDANDRLEDHSWISWMEIGSVIKFNDEIGWALLGNPKDFQSKSLGHDPIAKDRGFPINPGYYLGFDMKSIDQRNPWYREGELFGFTHFNYSEVNESELLFRNQCDQMESDWVKLFKLIDKFIEVKSLNANQVRIIAWYSI